MSKRIRRTRGADMTNDDYVTPERVAISFRPGSRSPDDAGSSRIAASQNQLESFGVNFVASDSWGEKH